MWRHMCNPEALRHRRVTHRLADDIDLAGQLGVSLDGENRATLTGPAEQICTGETSALSSLGG